MAQRPDQQPVMGNEVTVPQLSVVRNMLVNHIPANPTPDDMKDWLQPPQGDADCLPRAKALANILKPAGAPDAPLKLFNFKPTLKQQWDATDTSLEKGIPVVVQAAGYFISGPQSRFNLPTGYHVAVLLAKGDGFYVGFDPDVTATTISQRDWAAAAGMNNFNKISTMALGAGTGAGNLGSLCRKYYFDKTAAFPPIPRT